MEKQKEVRNEIKQKRPKRRERTSGSDLNVRIIPLGGLGEVGRNMMLLEYNKKILIIDVGLAFPEENMLGVDYFIPDTKYLEKRQKDILGIIITHGHFDHLGAVPYLIKKLGNPPIFSSRLSLAIVSKRQKEFPGLPKLKTTAVKNGSVISLGPFKVEFFRQNHSIPENLGLFIKTPVGNIVHTSDFKFDSDPMYEPPADFKKLNALAKRGILLLMSDSTNAEKEGHSLTEKEIMGNLEEIFKKTNGRIITATFSSLLNRIHQIITLSEKYNRKVAIEGYSMKANVEIAQKLGYLEIKKNTIIQTKQVKDYPDSRVTILCTGSQGEESAALVRITAKEHKILRLKRGDTVILSSSAIPGNERVIQGLKDNILRQGAKVFHYQMMDIHTGGHAKQQELVQMIKIMKPRFFLPIHGQYSMLLEHTKLARKTGIPEKNIVVAENGQIVNLERNNISILNKTVPSSYVMVDGLGVGDVQEVVLRDRTIMAKDGMFVIVVVIDHQTGKVKGSPDIMSRGFVYLKESKELLAQTRKRVVDIVDKTGSGQKPVNFIHLRNDIRNKIGKFLFRKTKRRPMVLPVIIKV